MQKISGTVSIFNTVPSENIVHLGADILPVEVVYSGSQWLDTYILDDACFGTHQCWIETPWGKSNQVPVYVQSLSDLFDPHGTLLIGIYDLYRLLGVEPPASATVTVASLEITTVETTGEGSGKTKPKIKPAQPRNQLAINILDHILRELIGEGTNGKNDLLTLLKEGRNVAALERIEKSIRLLEQFEKMTGIDTSHIQGQLTLLSQYINRLLIEEAQVTVTAMAEPKPSDLAKIEQAWVKFDEGVVTGSSGDYQDATHDFKISAATVMKFKPQVSLTSPVKPVWTKPEEPNQIVVKGQMIDGEFELQNYATTEMKVEWNLTYPANVEVYKEDGITLIPSVEPKQSITIAKYDLAKDPTPTETKYVAQTIKIKIKGIVPSTAMNDILIKVNLYDPIDSQTPAEQCDIKFTVLWVELRFTDPKTQPTISADNAAIDYVIDYYGKDTKLGPQTSASAVGYMYEVYGNVSPSDFNKSLVIQRFLIADQSWLKKNKQAITQHMDGGYNSLDSSKSFALDYDPQPNGKIYDLDTPDAIISAEDYEISSTFTRRINFTSWVTFKNKDGIIRCSENFNFYIRTAAEVVKKEEKKTWQAKNIAEGEAAGKDNIIMTGSTLTTYDGTKTTAPPIVIAPFAKPNPGNLYELISLNSNILEPKPFNPHPTNPYFWVFGESDDIWSKDENTTYIYTNLPPSGILKGQLNASIWTATVKVKDANGNEEIGTIDVVVNQVPIAIIQANIKREIDKIILTINASQSYDPDGVIKRYHWEIRPFDPTNTTVFSVTGVSPPPIEFPITVTSITIFLGVEDKQGDKPGAANWDEKKFIVPE